MFVYGNANVNPIQESLLLTRRKYTYTQSVLNAANCMLCPSLYILLTPALFECRALNTGTGLVQHVCVTYTTISI